MSTVKRTLRQWLEVICINNGHIKYDAWSRVSMTDGGGCKPHYDKPCTATTIHHAIAECYGEDKAVPLTAKGITVRTGGYTSGHFEFKGDDFEARLNPRDNDAPELVLIRKANTAKLSDFKAGDVVRLCGKYDHGKIAIVSRVGSQVHTRCSGHDNWFDSDDLRAGKLEKLPPEAVAAFRREALAKLKSAYDDGIAQRVKRIQSLTEKSEEIAGVISLDDDRVAALWDKIICQDPNGEGTTITLSGGDKIFW